LEAVPQGYITVFLIVSAIIVMVIAAVVFGSLLLH
jgi:hypothetical protein